MSDEIVREFLVESGENLDLLERELVDLEKDPQNRETLASVFRTVHTIKGTCGFLGFAKLEAVAHVGENLLSKLRDGELGLSPEIATALLRMVDAIRQMLEQIGATGNEGERNDQGLIDTLELLQEGKSSKGARSNPSAQSQEADKCEGDEKQAFVPTIGEILVRKGVITASDVASALQIQQEGDPRHIGEILVERGTVKSHEIVEALETQRAARAAVTTEGTIRVDVTLLDKLMNLVGELVLARNQILQFANSRKDSELTASGQRLDLITTELQEGVMKTRMQPIGNVWSKFPRTVRDVAASCGKQVRIEMEGKEIELDKTIIESIKDPLTHLVRNAVDHGIERPEVRMATGKPAEGRLLLRAFHEGGQVNIEISDDGCGLDLEKIRAKAVSRGLVSAGQAPRMHDREIMNLIFTPGFSTAEQVTNVSGRDVGMDVVRTNIEKIGGIVDVQSKRDAGTTVRMKIPLTLAIIPALVVTCAGDRYAIPQVSLVELVRIEEDQVSTGIEFVHGAPVYRLRERLLPLVYLDHTLGLRDLEAKGGQAGAVSIVVLQANDHQFGLVVSEVNDTEEIVVKPLGKQFKNIDAFAGATIMGDGKVALILDAIGLAQLAGVLAQAHQDSHGETEIGGEKRQGQDERQTLLVVQNDEHGRLAIPLAVVARLEEFTAQAIEKSCGREVVQYRGSILPLVRVSEFAGTAKTALCGKDEKLQVVVYSDGGQRVGLVVDRILDIVDEAIQVRNPSQQTGFVGSAIVQQRVTDLLDVPALLRLAQLAEPRAQQRFEAEPMLQEH
jgi:two-component system chemotaxis sensor kinase CheA